MQQQAEEDRLGIPQGAKAERGLVVASAQHWHHILNWLKEFDSFVKVGIK